MDIDLRIPVGLLFVVLGLIMTIFGLTSDQSIYHKSLGINVNLEWGIVELIFGSIMIAFGRSRRQLMATAQPPLLDEAAMTPGPGVPLTVTTRKGPLPKPPVPPPPVPLG